MKFELTEEQAAKVRTWTAEQDAIILARQRAGIIENGPQDVFTAALAEEGIAYYGAIGGELTYSFSPNSLGEVVIVTHAGTKAELDVSDYNW